jgi:hypothetical protein
MFAFGDPDAPGLREFTMPTTVPHPIFTKSFKKTASPLFLVSLSLSVVLATAGHGKGEIGEKPRISYLVSPAYPPLARQAMQSGDVTLTVTVDASGKPTDIAVNTPYPLLGGPTKETKWRFVPPGAAAFYAQVLCVFPLWLFRNASRMQSKYGRGG